MSAALKWRKKNELIIKGRTSNKLARQLFECRCPTQLITNPTSPSVTCCYFDLTPWLLNKRNLGTLVLSLLLLALWLQQKTLTEEESQAWIKYRRLAILVLNGISIARTIRVHFMTWWHITLAPGFSKYVISDLCKYASTRDWAVQNCKLHVTGL